MAEAQAPASEPEAIAPEKGAVEVRGVEETPREGAAEAAATATEKAEPKKAESEKTESEKAEPDKTESAKRRGGTSWGAGKNARTQRAKTQATSSRLLANRTMMYAQEAAHWFVGDLLEVSGFVRPAMRHRSGYTHFRPVRTAPDPWYFAGLIALEGCKIIDLFPAEKADALMRAVLEQADAASERHGVKVSPVVLGVMGRLGMGCLLMQGRVPDILIAKVMRLVLGSAKAAKRLIPDKDAHEQVTAALKIGHPVWWKVFLRRYDVRLVGEPLPQPKLIPIAPPAEASVPKPIPSAAPADESAAA